jgi:hypothetical protein
VVDLREIRAQAVGGSCKRAALPAGGAVNRITASIGLIRKETAPAGCPKNNLWRRKEKGRRDGWLNSLFFMVSPHGLEPWTKRLPD